jgi:hypothetical protein
MRKFAALLLATTVLLPAPAGAQVRSGAVLEAGLTSPAPLPALSPATVTLAPAAPSALALSPSLAAPAPAIVVPAIAAAAAAATPKLAPAALAAIKPAAAKPEKPGSDQARAAATALFDGSGPSTPAIGDGPSVPGSPSDPARASGLSPPTAAELARAYREARPKSKAVETFGRDFADAAAEVVQKYTFLGDHFLQQMNPRGRGPLDFQGRAVYRAAADLIEAHDDRGHAPSREFMRLLGRSYAFKDHVRERAMAAKLAIMKSLGLPSPAPHLPPSPIPGGEYWDMAAGMNALGFIHREIDATTKYSFFDYSPFVVSYLKTAAELAGAKNAEVVEADLNSLTKPAKALAVLRTKNAVNYVPGFDKKLEEMADWIAPKGQLVIQNDPNPNQRAMIVEKHGPLIRRLISEGWELEYGFSQRPGKFSRYALDTLILTRPTLAWEKTSEETASAWKGYRAAVAKADAEFSPFGFPF